MRYIYIYLDMYAQMFMRVRRAGALLPLRLVTLVFQAALCAAALRGAVPGQARVSCHGFAWQHDQGQRAYGFGLFKGVRAVQGMLFRVIPALLSIAPDFGSRMQTPSFFTSTSSPTCKHPRNDISENQPYIPNPQPFSPSSRIQHATQPF